MVKREENYMKDFVTLRKTGKFYSAYEDDSYVVHAIFDYKVSNGRVGFPCEVLDKVLNELEICKVSYKVFEKDKEIRKKKFLKNNYFKFFHQGLKDFENNRRHEEMAYKIRHLTEEQLKQVLTFIEDLTNAGE